MNMPSLPRTLIAIALVLAACDIPGATDGGAEGTDETGAESDGGDTGDDDDADDDDDDDDGTADGETGDDDDDDDDDDIPSGPLSCSTASLFAGNPLHDDPTLRAEEGQGLLDDPPLAFRNLAHDGDVLYTNVGPEVWSTDLSAAAPILHRVAGLENGSGPEFTDGPCADARFANLAGVATMSNGDVVVADGNANAVLQIVDPQGAGCTVQYVAGTAEALDSITPTDPPNVGDADGPGAQATFGLPKFPLVGDDDTIYVIDTGNQTIRAIANDADRTVSTVADLSPLGYTSHFGMTALGGKLYVLGQDAVSAAVLEVDLGSGEVSELVGGGPDAWLEQGSAPNPSGITNDGVGIIVVNHGTVWEITTEGEMSAIAGNGESQFFSPGYDPLAEQDAAEVELLHKPGRAATAHANAFAHYLDGAMLYVGQASGVYVERIACSRG